MLCQLINTRTVETHFDNISYSRSLHKCIEPSQKLTFTNRESIGNNRANALELLRYAYNSQLVSKDVENHSYLTEQRTSPFYFS